MDAARLQCSGASVGAFEARDCSIRIDRITRPTPARIRLKGKGRRVSMEGEFHVREGKMRIVLQGRNGNAAEAVASPGQPARLEATLLLRRRDDGLVLRFHPEVATTGIEGQLRYEAH